MSLWQEVRTNVIEWYTTAAEKTETWAQLGVRHYDRYGIHRKIGKEFAQLGGEVHALLREGQFADLADHEVVRPILERIERLEAEMRLKEAEISNIRESGAERKTSETSGSSPEDPEDEIQDG